MDTHTGTNPVSTNRYYQSKLKALRLQDFAVLNACLLFSGVAALIYETAWSQQLALVFGTSELAIAAVLAAYMAGLASGASIAGRWIERIRRPLLVYALLELGIALTALAVPTALQAASRLQIGLLGGLDLAAQGAWNSGLFYLLAAFLILLIPTALMGATLPLLIRHAVREDKQIGPRVGQLYMINTLGAALGALLAAFVLLPNFGLGATVWVAVVINGLVFLLAVLLEHRKSSTPVPVRHIQATAGPTQQPIHWILPAMLASGFVSLSYEVLWTRLLSHLLGGSIYAFGTMLATFLIGISLGAAIAARLASNPMRARCGFAIAQLGCAALFALGLSVAEQ
ncbi:MAG: fused MFS/spermidine synthase, partial [Candidatus Competibacteraceae bacterium]|nr:fused MFS/spermidine synthase [Candidatus Competibacteraceae bacterium]